MLSSRALVSRPYSSLKTRQPGAVLPSDIQRSPQPPHEISLPDLAGLPSDAGLALPPDDLLVEAGLGLLAAAPVPEPGQAAEQAVQQDQEDQATRADEQRPPGPLPVEDVVDAGQAALVEAAGQKVDQAEEEVEEDEERAPPEGAQLERHPGQPEVRQHQHRVGHVDEEVERVHVMDAGVVDEAPVGHGHPDGQARRRHVQDPVELLEPAVGEAGPGVEAGLALEPPAPAHEDGPEEGLPQAQEDVPVGQVDEPLLAEAQGLGATELEDAADEDAEPEAEAEPAVAEVPGPELVLPVGLAEAARLRRLELGVEPAPRELPEPELVDHRSSTCGRPAIFSVSGRFALSYFYYIFAK